MAQVHTELRFKGEGNVINLCSVSGNGYICITEESENIYEAGIPLISIRRDEWEEFKQFVDKQLSELEK